MKHFSLIIFGLILLIGMVAGCTRMVATQEIGDGLNDKYKILIATESSDFKDAVVADVASALRSDGAYIRIVDVSRLKDEDPLQYGAILIINSCQAWSLGSDVMDFLESAPQKDKVIVLATAGDPEWKAELDTVDAMTSASRMEKTDRVAGAVVEKIRFLGGH